MVVAAVTNEFRPFDAAVVKSGVVFAPDAVVISVDGVIMAVTVPYFAPEKTFVVEEYRLVVTTLLARAHAVRVVPLMTYP
jgi:hypothetical protein